ncbi:hypothetical protein [Streptomyces sp. NPDC054838]
MHDHGAFKERVDGVLVRLADEEERALLGLHEELAPPLTAQLRQSLAQGKRIRAAFLYWGGGRRASPTATG